MFGIAGENDTKVDELKIRGVSHLSLPTASNTVYRAEERRALTGKQRHIL